MLEAGGVAELPLSLTNLPNPGIHTPLSLCWLFFVTMTPTHRVGREMSAVEFDFKCNFGCPTRFTESAQRDRLISAVTQCWVSNPQRFRKAFCHLCHDSPFLLGTASEPSLHVQVDSGTAAALVFVYQHRNQMPGLEPKLLKEFRLQCWSLFQFQDFFILWNPLFPNINLFCDHSSLSYFIQFPILICNGSI
jgi:hypothetical protein